MNLHDLLPEGQVWLVWLVQALLAAGLIALLSGLIVRAVSAIPVVGPVLAAAIRLVFSNYEKWLSERVPRLAEQAVLATEERWRKVGTQYDPSARAEAKLREAMEALQQMAPGLPRDIAQRQIEAALARIRAMGMEQKAGGGR
ncbi:hypothetical protein [Thermus hydrothermalis]|uniref:hypothetical protein n=1 Tax=Thermus hydrothermalis TaxID=2908148 RepID=UPI001FAAC8D0